MIVQSSKADPLDERLFNVSHGVDQTGYAVTASIVTLGRSRSHDSERLAALKEYVASAVSGYRTALSRGRAPAVSRSWLARSLTHRAPRLRHVIAVDFGPLALMSCLYRIVSRRAALLVYLSEPPARPLPWGARYILRRADCVLVDGDAASLAISGLGYAAHRITQGYALDRYFSITPKRSREQARRIIAVGELNPGSGAYDLLANVAAWSGANTDRTVELHWIGEGDLSAMLAAQPLPGNLFQVFHGALDAPGIAAVFEQGGMVAMPSVTDKIGGHVAEALAAGLPIVGSRRSSEVRRHVTDGVTGWLFDPLMPGDMLDAVTRAFGTAEEPLAEMRLRARAAVSAPSSSATAFRLVRQSRSPPAVVRSAARSSP